MYPLVEAYPADQAVHDLQCQKPLLADKKTDSNYVQRNFKKRCFFIADTTSVIGISSGVTIAIIIAFIGILICFVR